MKALRGNNDSGLSLRGLLRGLFKSMFKGSTLAGLCLALETGTMLASADEFQWRPAAKSSPAGNGTATAAPAAIAPLVPAVPQAPATSNYQPRVQAQPASNTFSFRPALARPMPLVRAKNDDHGKPLPAATSLQESDPNPNVFQPIDPSEMQAIQAEPAQQAQPGPSNVAPTPLPRPKIVPSPGTNSGGIISERVISGGVISGGIISEGVISGGIISEGVISEGVISEGVISEGIVHEPGAFVPYNNCNSCSTGYHSGSFVYQGAPVVDGPYVDGGYVDGPYYNGGYVDGPYYNGGYVDGGYVDGAYYNGGFVGGGYVGGGYVGGPYVAGDCCGTSCGMSCGTTCGMSYGPVCGDVCGMSCGPVCGDVCGPVCQDSCCGAVCQESCFGSCFGGPCSDLCCPTRPRFWVNGAYLLWGFKTPNTPPLVTQSFNPAATGGNYAIIGQPGTQVIYGDETLYNNAHSGFAMNFGFWLPGRLNCWGLGAGFFVTDQQTTSFSASSTGLPNLARPIIVNGNEAIEDVAFPVGLAGTVGVQYTSQLWGLDAHLRRKLKCGPRYHLDFLIGYRHLQLEEGINITENLLTNTNTNFVILDSFQTRNQFNGAQIGLEGECHFLNNWFVQGSVKLAVGSVHQTVDISGNQFIDGVYYPAGILAARSNIGNYQRNRLAVVPEVNLKVGYEFNEHWRMFVGYNFLYISNVVRPGDQIDRNLDVAQIPPLTGTGTRPAVLFQSSDFWAQGINAGLEYRR